MWLERAATIERAVAKSGPYPRAPLERAALQCVLSAAHDGELLVWDAAQWARDMAPGGPHVVAPRGCVGRYQCEVASPKHEQ